MMRVTVEPSAKRVMARRSYVRTPAHGRAGFDSRRRRDDSRSRTEYSRRLSKIDNVSMEDANVSCESQRDQLHILEEFRGRDSAGLGESHQDAASNQRRLDQGTV